MAAFHGRNRVLDVVDSDHKVLCVPVGSVAAKGLLREKRVAAHGAGKLHAMDGRSSYGPEVVMGGKQIIRQLRPTFLYRGVASG